MRGSAAGAGRWLAGGGAGTRAVPCPNSFDQKPKGDVLFAREAAQLTGLRDARTILDALTFGSTWTRAERL